MTKSMKRIHKHTPANPDVMQTICTDCGQELDLRPKQKPVSKRIHKVVIKRMIDESPDTSWLGDYSNSPENEFSIDRNHFDACPCRWAWDSDEQDCECNAGYWDNREYRYFNPGSVETKGDPIAMRLNARADYARMESLNRGDFCFIGIRAEASYSVGGSPAVIQELSSGGLWGIESDSSPADLKETEDEQLSELKEQLKAIGFSSRAISAAFKTIEREEN